MLVFTGCQKENGPEDLLDLDMSNISMMTPDQQAVFDEATRRLDKHISFDADAGQYVMQSGVTAAQVELSQSFYAYFMRNFEATNTQLLEQQLQGYIAVEISKNYLKIINPEDGFDIYTRGGAGRSFGNEEEWEIGGINSFETYWFGVTIKLSNEVLGYILAGNSVVGTITTFIPAVMGIYEALYGIVVTRSSLGISGHFGNQVGFATFLVALLPFVLSFVSYRKKLFVAFGIIALR